jgi:hypothetical protein
MSAILTAWLWLRSLVGRKPEQVATVEPPALDPSPEDLITRAEIEAEQAADRVAAILEQGNQLSELRAAQGDHAAQLEDHGRRAARPPDREVDTGAQPEELGSAVAPPEDPGSSGARPLGGPRIDGGTSWVIKPSPGHDFACWLKLQGHARRGDRHVSWPSITHDREVDLALDRGSPGSGSVTLSTGRVRIEIRRRHAEVQITAEAAEVEGVEAWYERELPQAVWMLLGVDVVPFESLDGRSLPEILADLGVEQRRIEICLDIGGWQLAAGDERGLVSLASKTSSWRNDGELDGVMAGHRSKTPCSLGVYDKLAKLGSQRGPERVALLERWGVEGWDGEAVTRVELRLWGEALRLVAEDGVQLDATHPGAALDRELLGRLWVDGLTRHRLVDPSSGAKRIRDRPDLAIWSRAREAGGHVESGRLRRDVAARQLAEVRRHALARLGRVGAEVEVLLEGDGNGAELLDALDRLISSPGWDSDLARARARFAVLLEQGGEP